MTSPDFQQTLRSALRSSAPTTTPDPDWPKLKGRARRRTFVRRGVMAATAVGLATTALVVVDSAVIRDSGPAEVSLVPATRDNSALGDPTATTYPPVALDEALQCARDLAPEDPEYAGVGMDTTSMIAIVHRVGGDTPEARDLYAECDPTSTLLAIQSAPLSERDAETLTVMIKAALPGLEAEGKHIEYYGLDPRAGYLIGFTGPGAPGIDEIIEQFSIFGPGTVVPHFGLSYTEAGLD